MAVTFNRREVLAGLAMSLPGTAALTAGLAGCGRSDAKEPNVGGSHPRRLAVTISKETTYITEPLRPDGYPDYVAALNQRCSQGVTPENNAAVLFWKAVGPHEIEPDRRHEYFKMLGVVPPPDTGDYFRSSSDHVKIQKKKGANASASAESDKGDPLDDALSKAMQRPWAREEFPVWAEWLDINERPLALLMEASHRPRRYDPWFQSKHETAIDFSVPGLIQYRESARAFVLRAMLRVHDGKTAEAWQDLLACHRLARLLAQGPTIVESLIAICTAGIIRTRERALLEHGGLSAAQLAVIRRELASLPPICNPAEVLDFGERFFVLDAIVEAASQSAARGRILHEKLNEYGKCEVGVEPILDAMADVTVDWDTVLRIANAWFDRIVKAFCEPIPANRRRMVADVCGRAKRWEESVKDIKVLKGLAPQKLQRTGSEWIGKVIAIALSGGILGFAVLVNQSTTGSELTEVAFALDEYRAEYGKYPEKLAQLTAKYLSVVPKDIFSNNDGDLHYSRQDGGYVLYSIGPNGRNDGGRDMDAWIDALNSGEIIEHGYDDRWDDLVVRMPSK